MDREPAGDDGGRGEGVEHFPLRIQRSREGLVMSEQLFLLSQADSIYVLCFAGSAVIAR